MLGQFAPGDKFVRAKRVRLGAHPGEIQSAWAGFHRADPVFPVAPRHVVAAGIADDSRAKLSHQFENVTTEAVGIRRRMARLKDARIDAASHVFHEGAKKAAVELGNVKIGVDDDSGFFLHMEIRLKGLGNASVRFARNWLKTYLFGTLRRLEDLNVSLRLCITTASGLGRRPCQDTASSGDADVCLHTLEARFLADLRLSDWTLPQRHRSVNLEESGCYWRRSASYQDTPTYAARSGEVNGFLAKRCSSSTTLLICVFARSLIITFGRGILSRSFT